MNKLTKGIIGIIGVIAVVAIGYFLSENPSKVSAEQIKIGVVAPMSGILLF